VTHGGLFHSDGVTLDDIKKLERNRQPPEEGTVPYEPLTLWSNFYCFSVSRHYVWLAVVRSSASCRLHSI